MDTVSEFSDIESLQHVAFQLDTRNRFIICGHKKKMTKTCRAFDFFLVWL